MRSRDRLCLVVGAGALVASTLVMGSVFGWTQAVIAALIAGALLTQVNSRRKLDRISPIVVLLGTAIGLTALQLIPVPQAVVTALDPIGAALRADGAKLAGTSPWPCLSMDVAGTLRGLTYLVTLLGVALLSLRLGASDRGRFLLVGGVAITCGMVAAVTGFHAIINTHSIYGIFDVSQALPIVGPFVNLNHLGCLMAFGSTISIGLAVYEKQTPPWRALWLVIAVGCAAITLLSESRGAVVSLAIGIAITGALLIGRRLGDIARSPRDRTLSTSRLPVIAMLTIGFGLAVYSSAGGVAEQLGKTSLVELNHPTSKFAAWKSSVDLIHQSPWVGVGRGAVESEFTRVFPSSAFVTFSHLENEYVQAVVEWGIPGAILLAAALGWCIVTGLRKWRDGPLAAAAIGGIAGVLFQSSVDFGIELLGVAIPVTIVASTLQLVPLRETSRLGILRVTRGLMIAALVAGAVVLLDDRTTSLQEEHDALADHKVRSLDELTAAITRHPLDYYPFGLAGQKLMADHDPRAVEYFEHALSLHPYHPGLHRFVARLLVAGGHKNQAALEYSLAIRGAPLYTLLTEIVARLPDKTDAAMAIPLDYPFPVSIVKALNELERLDVAEAWLVRVALDHPSQNLMLLDQLYELASTRLDYDVALRTAKARLAIAETPTSRLMIARVHFRQKDYASVLEELADVPQWRGRIDERADAWLLVCDSYREQRRWDDALHCIHTLDATGSMSLRRYEVVQRESAIADQRTTEIRTRQIQNMERALNLPVDAELPVIKGVGSAAPAIPNPLNLPGISNPIRNPLNRRKPNGN